MSEMRVSSKTVVLFTSPLIHNQDFKIKIKTIKKFSTLFLRHLPKTCYKISKFSWWAFWLGDPRNFRNSYFVKLLFELELFASTGECSSKYENNLKKDANHQKNGLT